MSSGQGDGGPFPLGRVLVLMAIQFPWATKEYVLWQMTIAQVLMYLDYAAEAKNPKESSGRKTSDQMTQAELKAQKQALREQYPELRAKYGDIDDAGSG